MAPQSSPRIYGVCAVEADIVALIARASGCTHVLKWDLAAGTIERGACFRGTAYPRRCDVSPDGRYLFGYFKRNGRPHTVVSRLPWVYGLIYTEESGTWGRGDWFLTKSEPPSTWDGGYRSPPFEASKGVVLRLSRKPASPFFNEYRRGWIEAPDCPPRQESDIWDAARPTIILERSPKGKNAPMLRLDRGPYGRTPTIEGYHPTYSWREHASVDWKPLPDAAWADFSYTGRLVYTTWAGQAIEATAEGDNLRTVQWHDLSSLPKELTRAPDWARKWT